MLDNWNRSIHNLEIISFRDKFCYLPSDSDTNLKMDIAASFIKNFNRYSSVDYVRNKYVNKKVFEKSKNPYSVLLNNINTTVWETICHINDRQSNLSLKEENVITLGLTSSFMRLSNSFESSLFLITNQFYFESMAINRMIFEQINYCFNLSQLSPEEFDALSQNQINKLLSSTNITKLKEYFKISELGNFYSTLSTNAHIGLKSANEFIKYNEEIGESVITLKSITQSVKSAIYLLYITDLYGLVFEYCLNERSDIKCEFHNKVNGQLESNQKRETRIRYIESCKEYERLIKEEKVPVKLNNRSKKDSYDDLPF